MTQSALARTLTDAAQRRDYPGFVAAAIRDGHLIHESAHGLREPGVAMTSNAVFRIYSLTKVVTTIAVLQMVERGRIDLDAPASRYAPELAKIQVLTGFDARGVPMLRPPKQALSVRSLLTHNSGFGYTLWNADLARYAAWGERKGFNPLLDLPLVFDPGEAWEYGIGVDWAGKIVERVAGESLDRYFEDNIFGPLNMPDTAFTPHTGMRARIAIPWIRGALGEIALAPPLAGPTFLSGGGGLYSTAPDYLKLLSVIAGGKGRVRIIKPETIDLMTQYDESAPRLRILKSCAPGLVHDLDLWSGQDVRFGLGFLIHTEKGVHGRMSGSLSWAGRGNSYFWIDPREKIAAVLMTHLSPFPDPHMLDLLSIFERGLYEA